MKVAKSILFISFLLVSVTPRCAIGCGTFLAKINAGRGAHLHVRQNNLGARFFGVVQYDHWHKSDKLQEFFPNEAGLISRLILAVNRKNASEYQVLSNQVRNDDLRVYLAAFKDYYFDGSTTKYNRICAEHSIKKAEIKYFLIFRNFLDRNNEIVQNQHLPNSLMKLNAGSSWASILAVANTKTML